MTHSLRHTLKRILVEARFFSPLPRSAQYFLIVSQERTGSTLLSNLVSFHPEILTDMHFFYTPETWPTTRRPGRSLFTTRPVRGFKFKATHTPRKSSPQTAQQFFRQQEYSGLKIIRLQRENILRQALSAQMVGKRNDLHAWQKDAAPLSNGRAAHPVDVEDLIGRMEYFDRLTRFQERALEGIPHLHIRYETDLLPQDQHQQTANRIFSYLGLPNHRVKTKLKKLTSNDLSQVVSNLEELKQGVRNTRFAQFLDQSAQPVA